MTLRPDVAAQTSPLPQRPAPHTTRACRPTAPTVTIPQRGGCGAVTGGPVIAHGAVFGPSGPTRHLTAMRV